MRKKGLGLAVSALLAAALPAVFSSSSAFAAIEFPGPGLATNYDWAYLVLQDGGWPSTANNLTVLTQWMDSEEPASDWWNRNNPLNNGLGSGGGSGLGSYASVVDAAYYVAANLEYNGYGYPAIASALSASSAPKVTAKAIWDSAWAAGHYGHGKGWFSGTVTTVSAPLRAWGSNVVVTYPSHTIGPGADDGFTLNGPPQYWHSAAPFGLEGDARWTYSNGATGANGATWAPTTLTTGSYVVSVYVPASYADAIVTYLVTDSTGVHRVLLDQAAYAGRWVPLGLFTTATHGGISVHVGNTSSDALGSTYVGVDAMQFVKASKATITYPNDNVGPGGIGFVLTGPGQSWHAGAPYGLRGDTQWTPAGATSTASAQWATTLAPGAYDAQAFVPSKYATAHVTYAVVDAVGTHNVAVDQSKFSNQWVNLGHFTTGTTGSITVHLTNASNDAVGTTDVGADAIKFVSIGTLVPPATSISFGASLPRTPYGTEVTYAATVQETGTTPTGTVTFSIGPRLLCSGPLSGGSASCATSYTPVGSHVVTARYLGGPSFAPSMATSQVVVVRAASTTTLGVHPGTIALGGRVSYGVSVLGSGAIASGLVRIGVDGKVVCVVHLVSGTGACVATASQRGRHMVFARYAGDAHLLPSARRSSLTVP